MNSGVPSRRVPLPNGPLLLAISTWAVNFVALKVLYREVSPAAACLVRSIFMWIALLAICAWWRQPLTIPKGSHFRVWLQGFLSLGVYMIFFLEGLARTGGAEGAILLNSSPVWTALFAMAVRHEPFRWQVLVGALIAFGGVALTILGAQPAAAIGVSSQDHAIGVAMVLISAVIWAASTVISRPLLSEMTPLRLLAVSMPAAGIVLLPYGLLPTVQTDWASISFEAYATLFHVTFLAGVVGFLGFYAGVRKVGAAGAMFYQYFVPPIAALLEWAVLGKTIQPIQGLGFLIVVAGVAFAMRARTPVATAEFQVE